MKKFGFCRFCFLASITKSTVNFKFISDYENPGATFIFKEKVANIIFSKKPI